MRIQKYLIGVITLIGGLTFVGCGSSNIGPSMVTPPSYSISVDQLATRLGLTVQSGGSPYYELTNANNRVLLFTYDNGRVYVNGAMICQVGTTQQVNGTTYVSELLVPKIRSHLKTSYTPSIVIPDSPSYKTITGTIVIDPGHGGKDPGAISYYGDYEKTVNLSVSHKVVSYLKDRGIKVIMTRNSDTFPELNERVDLANRAGADLFVSIHADSHPKSSQRGYTIYIAPNASWTSKKTAVAIEQAMRQTGLSSVGIRDDRDFRVLVRTKMPAVLVECGYLTNPTEAAMLFKSDFQDRVARAIAEGIIASL